MADKTIASLSVVIGADISAMSRGLDMASKKTASFSAGISKIGGALSALGIGLAAEAIVDFGKKAVSAASEAEETANKFNVVFASVSEQASKSANDLAKSLFIATDESQKLLSNTADLLTGFGFTAEAALGVSDNVQRLAGDLASFNNLQGGTAEASDIITKALLGERDALQSLGVKILDTDLQARLAAKGMDKLTGAARLQAQANETLSLITEQSTNAIGDLARSSGSFANQQRLLQANFRNLTVAIGNEVLPTVTKLITVLNEGFTGDNAFKDALREAGQAANGLVKSFKDLINQFKFLLPQGEQAITVWDALSFVFKAITIPINTTIKALTALNRIVLDLITGAKSTRLVLSQVWKSIRDITVQTFSNIGDVVREAFNFRKLISEGTGDLTGAIAALKDPFIQAGTDIGNAFNEGFGKTQEENNPESPANTVAAGLGASTGASTGGSTGGAAITSAVEQGGEVAELAAKRYSRFNFELENTKRLTAELTELQAANAAAQADNAAKVEGAYGVIGEAVKAFSQTLITANASGEKSLAEVARAAVNSARTVISSAIAEGVARTVASALSSVPFPFNLAAGAFAGAAAQGLFSQLIPAFAKGGIVSGPTLAMIGEYAGARGNPEVIAPLDKLSGAMGTNTLIGLTHEQNNILRNQTQVVRDGRKTEFFQGGKRIKTVTD